MKGFGGSDAACGSSFDGLAGQVIIDDKGRGCLAVVLVNLASKSKRDGQLSNIDR